MHRNTIAAATTPATAIIEASVRDPTDSFSEPEPDVIESTTGFGIRVLGRTGWRGGGRPPIPPC